MSEQRFPLLAAILPGASAHDSMLRRTSLGRMVSTNTAVLLGTTGVLIVLLALLILFNENHNATKGYRLRTLERERSQLLLAEEVLKMHIAEAQSLETFLTDAQIASMVDVRRPAYMQKDSAVAGKEGLGIGNWE